LLRDALSVGDTARHIGNVKPGDKAMPGQFVYRWWESGLGPFEVKGDAASIYRLAIKLELPPRPFRSEIRHEDGTPADLEDLLAARASIRIAEGNPDHGKAV
jgi:hypothetical protein